MNKTIKFSRRELVWEYYEAEYSEKDWKEEIDFLKLHATKYSGAFQALNEARYKALKDVSFKTVCEILNRERRDIEWEVSHGDIQYTESLTEYMTEVLRNLSYDCGAVDCEYADDYDESLTIEKN